MIFGQRPPTCTLIRQLLLWLGCSSIRKMVVLRSSWWASIFFSSQLQPPAHLCVGTWGGRGGELRFAVRGLRLGGEGVYNVHGWGGKDYACSLIPSGVVVVRCMDT